MSVPCRVVTDVTSSGYERLTCSCGAVLVQQKYMRPAAWNTASRSFCNGHGDREVMANDYQEFSLHDETDRLVLHDRLLDEGRDAEAVIVSRLDDDCLPARERGRFINAVQVARNLAGECQVDVTIRASSELPFGWLRVYLGDFFACGEHAVVIRVLRETIFDLRQSWFSPGARRSTLRYALDVCEDIKEAPERDDYTLEVAESGCQAIALAWTRVNGGRLWCAYPSRVDWLEGHHPFDWTGLVHTSELAIEKFYSMRTGRD